MWICFTMVPALYLCHFFFLLALFCVSAASVAPGFQSLDPAGCRYVLSDATQHSLVLVDELGKGTEVNAGAALAGAILEALDGVGCKVGGQLMLQCG